MEIRKELKIGVFVLSVITASFFVINFLRGEDIFDREMELNAVYVNVEGLVESAPVYIKGYQVGKVTDVTYRPETSDFLVTCSVLKDFKIPTDSRIVIYAVDIMGGKGIRIDIGSSDCLSTDGQFLASATEPGLIDGIAAGISPLMSKACAALDSLSVTISGLNSILSDSNKARFNSTLAHLENTIVNVEKLSATFSGRSSDIDEMIGSLAELTGYAGSLLVSADSTVAGLDRVIESVNRADLEAAVNSLNRILERTDDPEGTVGKLFVDNSLYNSADSLLKNIDLLVREIQDNPKKFLKISVF